MNNTHHSLAKSFATVLNNASHLSENQKYQWAYLSAYMTDDEIAEAMEMLTDQSKQAQVLMEKLEAQIKK